LFWPGPRKTAPRAPPRNGRGKKRREERATTANTTSGGDGVVAHAQTTPNWPRPSIGTPWASLPSLPGRGTPQGCSSPAAMSEPLGRWQMMQRDCMVRERAGCTCECCRGALQLGRLVAGVAAGEPSAPGPQGGGPRPVAGVCTLCLYSQTHSSPTAGAQ
jgi:hypothetical protein